VSLGRIYIDWKQLLSDVITALDVEYSLARRVCVRTTYSLKDGVEISSEAKKHVVIVSPFLEYNVLLDLLGVRKLL